MSASSRIDDLAAVSIDAAASTLGVSRRTLYRLIASGEFPAPVKIGRTSRVLVRELEAFVRRQAMKREAR
ncbi:MAG: helix-turn-helix transcriptional regulator [Phycisphaerales bacterium]